MQRLWEEFLQLQESEIGVDSVKRWLRTLKITGFDAGNFYLEAKDDFQALWFDEHMRSKALKSLVRNSRPVKIHIAVSGKPLSEQKPKSKSKKKEEVRSPVASFKLSMDGLDPLCTFDRFCSFEGNLLAHKILCEVAGYQRETEEESPIHPKFQLAVFNPLYIYGGVGSGKTHLLMATAHTLQARGLKVVYAKAETFTEHVILAIRAGEMPAFRNTYREADVLFLDDVHLFSRKGATQEELFHTFNSLHLAGKQIILSASCSPQDLQLVEPRLVSRFEWGIVVPLESPQPTHLLQILRHKALALGHSLSPRVEGFLCDHFGSSPKSLCRALEALVLRLHLQEREVAPHGPSVEECRDLLNDLLEEEELQKLRPEHILQRVAENYGVPIGELTGRAQTRDLVVPRQLAMYYCRQNLKMPLTKIGALFERDHSTVMSSIKRVEEKLKQPDSELVADHLTILRKLQNIS